MKYYLSLNGCFIKRACRKETLLVWAEKRSLHSDESNDVFITNEKGEIFDAESGNPLNP